MKRILSLLFALCLLLSLVACKDGQVDSSSSSSEIPPATDYTEKLVPMQEVLRFSLVDGRTGMLEEGAISFDWSGNAITFTADCEGSVSLFLSVGKTAYNRDDIVDATVASAFSLTVDGVRTVDRFFVYEEEGLVEWRLAEDLPRGEHTFRVVRQSKIMSVTADLCAISLCGELKQMQSNAPFIEFIGDSITCGHGIYKTVEHEDANHYGYLSFLSDNAEEAYAVKTALALGARYSILGFSGSGYAFGWTPYSVPDVYGKTSYVRGDEEYVYERTPDLVVINLGTNDTSRWGILPDGSKLLEEQIPLYFEEEFIKFINTLVDNYGVDTPIVFAYGAVNNAGIDRVIPILEEVFPNLNWYTVALTRNQDACAGHPSVEGGTIQAQDLTTFLLEQFPELFQ